MNLEILSKDKVLAYYTGDKLNVINDRLLPIYLKRTGNVEGWLASRAIDCHRPNSRLLKKVLRLSNKDDVETVLQTNASTITDTYWVRSVGSTLNYIDVRFTNDYFADLALTGSYDSFNKAANSKDTRTPELSNIGSFEKCWKLKKVNGGCIKLQHH